MMMRTKTSLAKRRGWFAERFAYKAGRTHLNCAVCGRDIWLPACKAEKYKTCGGDCAKEKFVPQKLARLRPCEKCGKKFIPRQRQLMLGTGRFCSVQCSKWEKIEKLNAPEAHAKQKGIMRDLRAQGRIKYARGPTNSRWSGGKEAARLRGIERAKLYIKNNPDKARAWSHNRRVKKNNLGVLPSDAAARLMRLQNGRCAVCRCRLGAKYHLDHIVPIARNGRNEFQNVQLLCVPCNQHKAAKIPHLFMQSRGFLL